MKHLTLLLCYFTYLLFQSPPALATTQEVYRFERLWPLLPQPWHFGGVWYMAISPQGHLYVTEYGTFRIQKFDLEGHYITEFGKIPFSGPQDKEQWLPQEIAIDSQENVYVAYSHRIKDEESSLTESRHAEKVIHKFDAYGNDITSEKWTAFNQTLFLHEKEGMGINGIAIDRQDNVYLFRQSPPSPSEILKLTPNGQLLDQWPLVEIEGGVMAISTDYIYTVNAFELVSKYTLAGVLVKTWGGTGDQPGNFLHASSLAVDSQENVYVVDSELPSIQKFTSDGQLLARWIEPPSAELMKLENSPIFLLQQFANLGGFKGPDYLNYWLTFDWQKLLKTLNFNPSGIAVDSQDNVYVGFNVPNDSIRKYTPDGRVLNQWADFGNNPGQLHFPMDIVRDRHGNLYIADSLNQRIVKLVVKLDATGRWVTSVTSWGKLGNEPGEFLLPLSLAIDQEDNVYVVDGGTIRIQKFTANGDFITQWGDLSCDIPGLVQFYCTWLVLTGEQSSCSPALIQQAEELTCSNEPGNFYLPTGIATDQHNNVYVVDSLQKVIHKFSSKGKFLTTWENAGENAGEFGQPLTIKVDNHDNVYITDMDQHNIKKFTTTGKFIKQWGTQGRDEGQLQYPTTLTTDEVGNIYVYDGDNYRIQKFTTEGEFVTQWGEFGTNPGQLGSQGALAVTPDGNQVYFIDLFSNRLQIFNKTLYDVGKAIIVAGGRGKDDSLWDATQMVSNFAYRALLYQGFTKDTIYYLNAITNLDLDNNGEFDDVDATSTSANLQWALTEWVKDTDNLTLFLTDHGGSENFSFSETEELTASDLSGWLKTWQVEKNGKVKIIYDACQSGSFLRPLADQNSLNSLHFVPPADQNRLVITSATADQSAYFLQNGSFSFSYLFWDEILKGVDIGKAFTDASTTVDYLGNQATTQNQTPQLDANGNGQGNEPADWEAVTRQKVFIGNVGNGTVTNSQAPTITAVPPQTLDQPNTPVTITAAVKGVNKITRVWVVVRSPADLTRPATAGTITALPSFELTSVDETHWKGHYQEFDQEGTYFLAIYAYDSQGNTSQPQMTTVQVQNPLRHRALLIGGELPAKVHRVQEAYDALKYQGYTDEDIYYLSNLSSPGVDGSTTVDNVKFALLTWAQANPTQNLIVYVEGVEAQGAVMLNASNALTFEQLDEWLDTLQATLPGPVIVIYQGALSDKIWSVSTPPTSTTRIVMSSTSLREDGCLNPDAWQPLFAEAFWRAVRQGEANLLKVFNTAKGTMTEMSLQEPHYDANGNGIPDEKPDQEETNKVRLGLGIVTAADEPRLGDISPTQVLRSDTTTAMIVVHRVNTLDDIQQVTAEIKPPCDCQEAPTTIVLQPTGKGGYEGRYAGFRSDGNYLVIISATDTQGRKSFPKMTWVQRRLPLIPSQAKYHTGETVQVKLPSSLLDTEEQYLAIRLPNGSFYTIQGLNQFMPLGETVPVWSGVGEEVIDWKVAETLPKGEYRLYLVRVAKGSGLTLPVATELVRETRVVVE
jgi:sugar lactone lactonase YvrE